MKAAIVDSYSTHVAPLGRGWIEGLYGAGLDAVKCQAGSEIPDDAGLIVYMDSPAVAPMIDNLRPRAGVRTIVSVSYTPHFDLARASENVDLFVSHTIKDAGLDAQFASHGGRVAHVPFGARQAVFSPGFRRLPARYDVAFIGSVWHGDRGFGTYFDPLLQVPGLRVFHSGRSGNNFIPYIETRQIYDLTKVCINFHYPEQRDENRTELNARTFDLALMGACQVIDHLPEGFFGLALAVSPEEWVDRIVALVNDDETRGAQKATAMHAAVEHTWTKRMRVILNALQMTEAECKPICT